MTVKRYKELKWKYFCGPVYNNIVEMVRVGFYTDFGRGIPELDDEPGVQRMGYADAGGVWYCVYAPQHMKYEEV